MRLSASEVSGLIRPPERPPKRVSPHVRSLQSRLAVLSILAELSHLRPIEVSAACWPNARYGLQLAQRCLKRLAEENEVRAVPNSVGSTSFVLTHSGANTLRLHGLRGKHGLDLRSFAGGSFLHHSMNSRYAIEQRNRGHECHTEYGIACGFSQFSTALLRDRFKKLCDGLLIRDSPNGRDDPRKLAIAIEVESAKKPHAEIAKILSISSLAGQQLDTRYPHVIGGVVFVFNDALAHRTHIEQVARALWNQRTAAERYRLASCVTLAKMQYSLPLSFLGLIEEPLKLA
jgi:hypothetical protein